MPACPRTPLAWFAAALAAVLSAAVLTAPAAAAAPGDRRADWRRTADRPLVETLRGDASAGTVVPRVARTPSGGSGSMPRLVREQRSAWQVTYAGSFTDQQRAAFQSAVDVWSTIIGTTVPITVSATFRSLDPGVLGQAGPGGFFVYDPDGRYDVSDTAYPVALANAVLGEDVDPSGYDIVAEFNSTEPGIYYGTDGRPPPGALDFPTVVLHELGHGLGFAGLLDVDPNGRGTWDPDQAQPVPAIYDRFAVRSNAQMPEQDLLGLPRGSFELGSALTSGEVYWDGPLGKAGYNGARPRLYTPPQWNIASSYSHLDEDDFPAGDPNSLMTPFIQDNEVIRDPGPVAIGMLADMGYDVPRPLLPGSRYTPLDPVRLLDTREGLGAPGARIPAGGVIDLQVTGGAVPTDARAVVLNITATAPTASTDVRVYPTPRSGSGFPVVSNLNVRAGETRANLATVPVGANGKVRLRNAGGSVHLLADLAGWYAPTAASTYQSVAPVRILSTRDAIGTATRTVGPGELLDLTVVGGERNVPATATAVVLGVTAFSATSGTDVRVYPRPSDDVTPPPVVSNLNLRPGPPVAGLAVVKVGRDGQVRFRNQAGNVHLIADLAGWFEPTATGSHFHVLAPERLLDTRLTSAPRVGPGGLVDLQVADAHVVPTSATAVALNITGVGASSGTDVRVFPRPTDSSIPVVSNLNLGRGQTAASAAIVQVGSIGQVRLRNEAGEVALLADIAGWFG